MNESTINLTKKLQDYILWQQELGVTVIYAPELKAKLNAIKSSAGLSAKSISQIVATTRKDTIISPEQALPVSLAALRERIGDCRQCNLHQTRSQLVFGEGNPNAHIMFIGEAPGAEEDQAGQPFVGETGQLLTNILKAIQLTREEVYVCNIVKCQTAKNRDPLPGEIEKCELFLRQQIQLIKPKFICALGRTAAQALVKRQTSLNLLRQKIYDYHGTKLIVTYHPAAILQSENEDRQKKYKRDVWEDMKLLRRLYDEELKIAPANA